MALLNTSKPPTQPPNWLAPAVLGLLLLIGAGLHYWPEFNGSPKPGRAATDTAANVRPTTAHSAGRAAIGRAAIGRAVTARLHPVRNARIANSEFCLDCESYYLVHDGRGGKIRRSEGYTTRCCPCGSTIAFSDGYYYDIRCEGKQITARMGKRISDSDEPR